MEWHVYASVVPCMIKYVVMIATIKCNESYMQNTRFNKQNIYSLDYDLSNVVFSVMKYIKLIVITWKVLHFAYVMYTKQSYIPMVSC